MLEKGKINSGEFQLLVIVFSVGTSVLSLPALLTTYAKQDAWIASILTTFIGLFFVFIYNKIAALYPFMTYVELNEKIFGKWFGKFTSLLYLFYMYHIASGSLRQIGDFFSTQVIPETPIVMIMAMFLIVCIIGVRLGLEVICRTVLIFFPYIVSMIIILFLLLIPLIQIKQIQPIFGEGMKPIMMSTFEGLGIPYLQYTIFLMLTPFISENAKIKKAFYRGTLIGGAFLTLLIVITLFVLGPELTSRQTYSTYILGKKITIGGFLDRVEVIVAIIWILTVYFKVTICYYGITMGLAQVLKLNDYKILTFPLAFLIVTFSVFMHPDIVHVSSYISKALTPYSLTICLFLPIILLLVGKIKKRFIPN